MRPVAPAISPYRKSWLRPDILAGLAAGAVVIPQAMAYATVANMPVQIGLYTCMLPLVVYAFIGGSRTASVSTTSTIATLTASALLGAGIAAESPDPQTHLVTLTLMVGGLLLVARLLRLGAVIENINQATLIGLKAGIGLTVAAAQLPKLLGVESSGGHDGFFKLVWSALRQLDRANVATVVLSLVSIAILLLIAKLLPAVPGPLVVVALGIALAAYGGLTDHGVKLIPEVPRGIPLPSLPALDHLGQLAPGAMAIALMAFLETVAVARSVRRPDEPQIDANRELSANGMAAVIGSFFHSLPPAAGFSQTGVNMRAGARSQVSGLVTAGLAVLVALFLAPVLSKLPDAVLGAMVFVAVMGLIDVRALKQLYHFDRFEFLLAAIVALFGLTVGLLPAVGAGVLMTLYLVLREVNHAHVLQLTRNASGSWTEGVEGRLTRSEDPLVVRTQIGMYTASLRANADAVAAMAKACQPPPATVVWVLSHQPKVTSTILDGLRDAETQLATDGLRVVYAELPEAVLTMARRWPWWRDEVEAQGRYLSSIDEL
ncbi:sulfate transporter [Mycolicibacterium moriokaense]|nr:sulfate transporter [Mycolicibacterium moriokaense]